MMDYRRLCWLSIGVTIASFFLELFVSSTRGLINVKVKPNYSYSYGIFQWEDLSNNMTLTGK